MIPSMSLEYEPCPDRGPAFRQPPRPIPHTAIALMNLELLRMVPVCAPETLSLEGLT